MTAGLAGLTLFCASEARASLFRTTLAPEAAGATGSGVASLLIDELTNSLKVKVNFSGLSGNTTVAHIHGPTPAPGTGTASVMVTTPTLPSFPVGYPNGTYDYTLDMLSPSTYRPGFITASGGTTAGARDAFLASLLDGKAYLNVHTTTFTGGEIRGFFSQAPVPGPLPVLGAGAALGWSRRLRRRQIAVR